MKRKIFIPHSIGFILLNCFLWGLSALYIVVFIILPICGIELSSTPLEVQDYIILIVGISFLLYSSIRFLLALKIHMRKDSIYTFGDMLPKFEKVQYKTSVKYKDIVNVKIISDEKNSKNKKIAFKWLSSAVPKKYIEIYLVDDTKERICINYYTKSQVTKLLNTLNDNMIAVGNVNLLNVNEILESWYTTNKYNKSKKNKK